MRKWLIRITVVLSLILIAFVYVRFYFVFAEGTKAGVLNTFQKKGYIFKTYEGKIIQSGFRANVQSNEFSFSVTDEKIALQLLNNAGKEMELHYKRYFGRLPWRGHSYYIVDSIYRIYEAADDRGIQPK